MLKRELAKLHTGEVRDESPKRRERRRELHHEPLQKPHASFLGRFDLQLIQPMNCSISNIPVSSPRRPLFLTPFQDVIAFFAKNGSNSSSQAEFFWAAVQRPEPHRNRRTRWKLLLGNIRCVSWVIFLFCYIFVLDQAPFCSQILICS